MRKNAVELLSFGNRFWFASFLYVGLGLLILGVTPGFPPAYAIPDCEEGMVAVDIGEGVYECQCPDAGDGPPGPVEPQGLARPAIMVK